MAEGSDTGATTAAAVPAGAPGGAPATPPATAGAALAAAKAYARQALAPETRRAYAADWAHFAAWCAAAGCAPLPAAPAAVAAYLASLAPLYSRSALERRLAAVGHAHRARGLEWSAGHPAVRSTLRGIWRAHGSRRRQCHSAFSSALLPLAPH